MSWKNHILAILLLSCSFLYGQEQPQEGEVIDTIDINLDLFDEADPLEITLTLDLKEFQRNKYKGEYVPVTFTYQINDTLRLEKSMRIKARGEFRREHCSIAPFWLNIRKADVMNQNLQDTKKIKIVTHCRESNDYQDYLLKEYLTYKIYNLLSPASFRVRLIRMKYVDTGRKGKVTESWAFMIEPEEMLAERNQGVVIENDQLSMRLMEPGTMDLVSMFMFMIGNPDYSITGRHNVKILGLEGFGAKGYTPVPYDFDYTGIVDAIYAIPGENLGIKSIRDRYFMGLCREEDEYQKAIDEIEMHHQEILDLIDAFPYMEERAKSEMIGYLESYFNMASVPNFTNRWMKSTCR
jgi:hypothetical protein